MTSDRGGHFISMEQQYYTIKIAAELCGMHEQSLRMYERRGLIAPQRSPGNIRRFSAQDVEQIRFIKRLVDELGVNLAGVEVIMHMRQQLIDTQQELQALQGDQMLDA
ncbi:MAG: helix-turn-helix transcriptional regulator [Chloroflexota bacterium]|nr:helix-turn-helix transcriptional regulator [Chloroflexota bacterium]